MLELVNSLRRLREAPHTFGCITRIFSIVLWRTARAYSGAGSGFAGGAQVGYNYLLGPALLGGAVWGQRSIDGAISASANYWTWTAGGGIEGLVTERWSMKLEFLYMGTPSTSLLPGNNETANNNLIRVGVNYHF